MGIYLFLRKFAKGFHHLAVGPKVELGVLDIDVFHVEKIGQKIRPKVGTCSQKARRSKNEAALAVRRVPSTVNLQT